MFQIFRQAQNLPTSASETYVRTYLIILDERWKEWNVLVFRPRKWGRKSSVRSAPSGYQLLKLRLFTPPVEYVHAFIWACVCFQLIVFTLWACARFNLSMCKHPSEHVYTFNWSWACFQLSMCMHQLSMHPFTCLHFSICPPVLLWLQVNPWKTGWNKQVTGMEQSKHIPWKFFRRYGNPCVPYPPFPLFHASIDIIYSRFTHTFSS